VGFHDYAAIYAVPGLYERVFYSELGMRSSDVVGDLYGQALRDLGLDPAQQRVLDFGAGNGIGGERLRALGVGSLIGLDLEPVARTAAERDRPGLYDDYLTGDLGDEGSDLLEKLSGSGITAVVALSAIGIGHVPPATLERGLSLLSPESIFAFAVKPSLMPDSEEPDGLESGYPGYLRGLLGRSRELARATYVHRRHADGSDDEAVALVGQL